MLPAPPHDLLILIKRAMLFNRGSAQTVSCRF
jgi:hypothetical protein